MYQASTHDILVTAEVFYIPERSEPPEHFWAYRITIDNRSNRNVQLLRRHWLITDENGKREEVRGDGVVGEQPELAPGDSYTYTSGCSLKAPSGMMAGEYTMAAESGELIEVTIPAFSLDLPNRKRPMN
ncbi:MAG: Co2+/Mg2+ efflux protein ApaG [Rhizobiaceae bacterium]